MDDLPSEEFNLLWNLHLPQRRKNRLTNLGGTQQTRKERATRETPEELGLHLHLAIRLTLTPNNYICFLPKGFPLTLFVQEYTDAIRFAHTSCNIEPS
jgi:hypothetical protein